MDYCGSMNINRNVFGLDRRSCRLAMDPPIVLHESSSVASVTCVAASIAETREYDSLISNPFNSLDRVSACGDPLSNPHSLVLLLKSAIKD